jgi:hypothetical protein
MEDNLNMFGNRRPHFFSNGRLPQFCSRQPYFDPTRSIFLKMRSFHLILKETNFSMNLFLKLPVVAPIMGHHQDG